MADGGKYPLSATHRVEGVKVILLEKEATACLSVSIRGNSGFYMRKLQFPIGETTVSCLETGALT